MSLKRLVDARFLSDTAKCIEVEEEIGAHHKQSRFIELFSIPRNRRAARAATVVM